MFDMLGNILKNMVSKPATRLYPMERRTSFKDTRGHISIDIEGCIFCGMCSKKCPSKAIAVNRNEKSWEIDPFKCISCNECEEVCPKKCIINNENFNTSALIKEKRKSVQQPKSPKEEAQGVAANAKKAVEVPPEASGSENKEA